MRDDELVEMKTLIKQLKIDETIIRESMKMYIDNHTLQKEHWFMPVCIYAACKQREITMTLKTLSETTQIQRKDLARGYRKIVRNSSENAGCENPNKDMQKIAKTQDKINFNTRSKLFVD